MQLAVKKRLKPNAGLTVEFFSPLSRLPIDEAMSLFLDIIGAGVTLVTLADRRAYTRQSIRANQGEIYQVASMMQAARAQAEATGYYSTKAWRGRRGSATNIYPSWITRQDDKLILDPAKHPTVVRICHMALMMGVNQIVVTLNAESLPVLNDRKRRHRGTPLWDKGSVWKMLRGRQLLGQQEVAHYIDGKSKPTGEVIQAYPAAIDEKLWLRLQAKLDSRTSGTHNGRNVSRMTNLFGDLARCQCGERMKVVRKGQQYVYLRCSAASVGACEHKDYFRLDRIELTVLPAIADVVIDDTPSATDPTVALERQIIQAKVDAAKIAQAYKRAMLRSGELAERTAAKLEVDHQAKTEVVANLQRQLNALQTAIPAKEQQQAIQSVLSRALAGEVAARAKIADALPGLLKRLTCLSDGRWQAETDRLATTFGGSKPPTLTVKLRYDAKRIIRPSGKPVAIKWLKIRER